MAAVTDEEKVAECIDRSENDESSSSQKRSKHSKKHKHKHSRKHKHKHKKHKHKIKSSSRSRSKSTSRSRSRSQSDDNSDDDSKFDASLIMNSEGFTSFKLTKSVSRSRSPSPSSKKVPERVNTKRKSPPFSSEGNFEKQRKKSRSKSKSPPFYTAADIESREKVLARGNSKSPPLCTGGADLEGKMQEHFESKFKSTFCPPDEPKSKAYLELKNGSTSPPPDSAILTSNDNLNSQCTAENTQESTTNSKESEPKRSRSKSPNTTCNRTRTKSSSRSVSPKQRKTKQSHSKSRSRSPRKKRSKKSRSRSSSSDKKRSRKRSKSRSLSSRSRSRSPKKSSQSHRGRSRDRRNRSPVQRGRSLRSPSPRRRYGNSSFDRRRTRLNRSFRRSPSPKHSYSKRSRSRTPHGRYRRKSSRSVSPRRGRSRSPRSKKYSRRSQSKSRSRRSRSRSYSRKQRLSKSRSRSRSKSRDRSKRRSRSKSADTSSEKKSTTTTIEKGASSLTTNVATAKDLVGKAPTVSDPSNKRSLAQLTEFCKKLTEARGISEALRRQVNDNGDTIKEEDDPAPSISHPFLVVPKKDITIPQVIFPVKPILPPMNMIDSSKPLTEQFPVSCGTKHHEKEREESTSEVLVNIDGAAATAQPVFQQPQIQQKLDISGLVVKRLDAQRRLQINPSDIDAMLALQEIEMKLNNWCQSNVKPGQYTGQLVKQMMPKEKMNTGYQAWARKDMFLNLNPVSGGIGMKLLQKMGWEPGQVLGKRGEGIAEPIALPVKVDRKGLSSHTEKPVGKKAAGKAVTMDLQGKHPISLLQEYCARRKWQVPEFTLIFDEGPPHSKQFLFKVAVNDYEYQHPVVSGNKKHAKAQAAVAALKGLALIPEDTEF